MGLAAPSALVLAAVKRKKKAKGDTEVLKGAGALTEQEVGKMLSKALKVRTARLFHVLRLFFFTIFSHSCPLLASSLLDMQ